MFAAEHVPGQSPPPAGRQSCASEAPQAAAHCDCPLVPAFAMQQTGFDALQLALLAHASGVEPFPVVGHAPGAAHEKTKSGGGDSAGVTQQTCAWSNLQL
jgi:hypothetical protein